ncbi:MAG: glycosyltransferase family 87 protein [Mariniblastus sp.]
MPDSYSKKSDPLNFIQRMVRWLISSKQGIVLGLAFLTLGTAFAGVRAYRRYAVPDGVFKFENSGLSDFHNGGYFPAMAFRDGVNPYSPEACEAYTLTRSSPTYSPVVFMLHLPFTYLRLEIADVVYFAWNWLLIGLLAYFSLTMSKSEFSWGAWVWIFALFVFSRCGHITLFTGYFTAQLVIGTVVAIHFAKTRPVLAGLGMMLASGKPTYIIPLILLMTCRKNYKAVAIGISFCALAAAVGIGWLVSHSSLGEVIDGVKAGQLAFDDDPTEFPVNTWTRLDAVGVVSKVMAWKPDNKVYLAMMCVLLVVPGIAIFRTAGLESNSGATGLTGMIVCLALLVTIYHHSYDSMLIAIAWVGATFFSNRVCPELRRIEHLSLSVLLGIPALNYVATMRFRDAVGVDNQSLVWNVVTSVNGVCLLLALSVVVNAAFRFSRSVRTTSSSAN